MRNNFKKFAAFAENGTKALKLMKKKLTIPQIKKHYVFGILLKYQIY